MSLSTGEIAERIRRPGMDTGMVIERIKHWTRLKLLQPVGGRRPGTGRHYRYDELELVPVAILSALADAGASIQGLGDNLLGGLAKAQAAYDKWEAKNRQGSFFLVGT